MPEVEHSEMLLTEHSSDNRGCYCKSTDYQCSLKQIIHQGQLNIHLEKQEAHGPHCSFEKQTQC